jgi:hypothetical protein
MHELEKTNDECERLEKQNSYLLARIRILENIKRSGTLDDIFR